MHGRALRALLQPPPKGTKTGLKRPRLSPSWKDGSPQGSAQNPQNTEPPEPLAQVPPRGLCLRGAGSGSGSVGRSQQARLRGQQEAVPPGPRTRQGWRLTAREECVSGAVPCLMEAGPQTLAGRGGQLPHDSALACQPPKQVTGRPSRPTSRKSRAHRTGRKQKVKLQHRPQNCFLKQTSPLPEKRRSGCWRGRARGA